MIFLDPAQCGTGLGRVGTSLCAAATLACAVAAVPAGAVTITVTDVSPTYVATIDTCASKPNGHYWYCNSTAALSTTSLAATDTEFKKSFDAWNSTNAAGSRWTLANGGALPGGELKVNTFDALAFSNAGGLEIDITWTYSGTDKSSFYWSQGILPNYMLDGSIGAEHYKMDVMTGQDKEPPLYPFQYADQSFYDKPLAPWPDSSFKARAFLSKADYSTRTLTIYEGVSYQFQLSATQVPVPPALGMTLSGLLAVAALRVQRRRG